MTDRVKRAKTTAKAKAKAKANKAKPTTAKTKPKAKAKAAPRKGGKVRLLSGGNPQIAKGDGEAPVQAYIAAMPGWKRAVGERLDALITKTVPKVKKVVKWNSPMYGTESNGLFLGVHCFDKYIKVAFFRGAELTPVPPDPSKDKNTRYYNIYEGKLDEKQFAAWVKQAAALPGWMLGTV